MSGENSAPTATDDAPGRALREEETVGERIEALPNTVLFFLLSFGILLSAAALHVAGIRVLAGVVGATAVIFMALAALTHVVYVLLGKLG